MSIIDTKITFFKFLPYECGAAEEYLERMARKGWLLQSVFGAFLTFKRIEPQKLKFSVDIVEKISEWEAMDGPVALEYREYCRAAGWNYVDGAGKIQIFYTEDIENTIPIHTDEEEKFMQVVKASAKNMIGLILLALVVGLNFNLQVRLALSDNSRLLVAVAMFSLIVTNCIDVVSFLSWIIRAKTHIKKKGFMPYNKYNQVKLKNILNITYATLLLGFALKLTVLDNKVSRNAVISVLLGTVAVMTAMVTIKGIKEIRYRKTCSKKNGLVISLHGLVLYLYIVIILVSSAALWSFSRSGYSGNKIQETKLVLEEYGYTRYEKPYINQVESILSERVEVYEYGKDNSIYYDMFNSKYPVVVKFYRSLLFASNKHHGENFNIECADLPGNIKVYTNSERSSFILVSEYTVVKISNNLKDIDEKEFLDIAYKKLF